MELKVIEKLLDKYFEARTSTAEESTLREYFSSPDVAPHLEQYKRLFGYFEREAEGTFQKEIPLRTKRKSVTWLSAAAGFVLLSGLFTVLNKQPQQAASELGTFNDPDVAFQETQKALNMLSGSVNIGIYGMGYLEEYEQSKDKIFKDEQP